MDEDLEDITNRINGQPVVRTVSKAQIGPD
jgi:hypothetical protein